MKRFVSILMSLVLMLVVLGPTTAMAQEFTDEHHHDSNTESVKEVPVTADMLQQAKEKGAVLNKTALITLSANCNHTYSSWTTINEYNEYNGSPSSFGKCFVKVEYQMRYCTKCNVASAREKRTQLSHSWRNYSDYRICTRCEQREDFV